MDDVLSMPFGVLLRCYGEAARAITALGYLPHRCVGCLDVTPKAVRIKQWVGPSVARKLLPNGLKKRIVSRQSQGQCFLFLKAVSYEFWKTNGMKEARGDPTCKGFPLARHQG